MTSPTNAVPHHGMFLRLYELPRAVRYVMAQVYAGRGQINYDFDNKTLTYFFVPQEVDRGFVEEFAGVEEIWVVLDDSKALQETSA